MGSPVQVESDEELLKVLKTKTQFRLSPDFKSTLSKTQAPGTANLLNNNLGDEAIEFLIQCFANNHSPASSLPVKTLHLDNNDLTDRSVIRLAEFLEGNSTIGSLFIGVNDIGDAGIERLSKALVSNKTLKWLSLPNNKVGDKGALSLIHSVLQGNSVERVFLNGNKLTPKGEQDILEAVKASNNSTLREILLYYDVRSEIQKQLTAEFSMENRDLRRKRAKSS